MDPLIESHPVYPLALKYGLDLVPAGIEFIKPVTGEDVRELMIYAFMAGWAVAQSPDAT